MAPASLGKHLAIGLETLQMFTSCKNNKKMEEKNIYPRRADHEGWHPCTELSVDVKTLLRTDRRILTGKEYLGVLRRDSEAEVGEFRYRDAHLTFTEMAPSAPNARNPRLFDGRLVTLTQWGDGSLHPNFKRMPRGLSADAYAIAVCNELRQALGGLVGEV